MLCDVCELVVVRKMRNHTKIPTPAHLMSGGAMNEIDSSGRPGFHKHIAALVIYGDAFAVDSHHFRLTRQCLATREIDTA